MTVRFNELSWKNLTINNDDGPIIKECNGEAPTGKIHLIVGESNSGKTTLLNTLAGYIPQKLEIQGEIFLDKEDRSDKILSSSPFLPHKDALFDQWKVYELFRFYDRSMLDFKKLSAETDLVLSELNLHERQNQKISELTKNECQKLVLACELVSKRQVLFLDDIFDGLSTKEVIEMIKLIKKFTINKGLIVMITSRVAIPEIDEFVDNLSFLSKRKLTNFYEILKLQNESSWNIVSYPSSKLFEFAKNNKQEENSIRDSKEHFYGQSSLYQSYSCRPGVLIKLIYRFLFFGAKACQAQILVANFAIILSYFILVYYLVYKIKPICPDEFFLGTDELNFFTILILILLIICTGINSFITTRTKQLFFRNKAVFHYECKKGLISGLEIFVSAFLSSFIINLFFYLILFGPLIFVQVKFYILSLKTLLPFMMLDCFHLFLETFLFDISAFIFPFLRIVIFDLVLFVVIVIRNTTFDNYYLGFAIFLVKTFPQYLFLSFAISKLLKFYLYFTNSQTAISEDEISTKIFIQH
ncbi:ABC transporter [Tubulinosema ratisbonensis]|uniref:ABC transporter n=1 Tax=Tubulinosema ratisbonensis TaxID=291195 RepID=A0A437AP69_9MICR|nr:ABC transporter [Tubulinosema ratisbonensis]